MKKFLEDLLNIIFIGLVAIAATNLYDNFTYEEPEQLTIDIYARDNTVHTI